MFDINNITNELKNLPPRIILLGLEKSGKSTFAAQFPNTLCLYIDKEQGVDRIAVDKPQTAIKTYEEFEEALKQVCQAEHSYKTLMIDSSSTLEMLIWTKVSADNRVDDIADIGWQKGYENALTYWKNILNYFDWLRENKNMLIILTGHTIIKTITDPLLPEPYDCHEWDIHKKAIPILKRWADGILFTKIKNIQSKDKEGKVVTATTSQYKLYTQSRPTHPGGGRGEWGLLPYEMDLNYNTFSTELEKARLEYEKTLKNKEL